MERKKKKKSLDRLIYKLQYSTLSPKMTGCFVKQLLKKDPPKITKKGIIAAKAMKELQLYLSYVMVGLAEERIYRKWHEEIIKTNDRKALSTVHEAIGKSIEELTSKDPLVRILDYSKLPTLGVKMKNQMFFYFFSDNICVDAYTLSDELARQSMSEEVMELFRKYFEAEEMVRNDPEAFHKLVR